jgi:type I restriction enzyme S subunit
MTTTAQLNGLIAKSQPPDGWQRLKLDDVIVEAQLGFACGERDPNGVVQLRMNNVTNDGRLDWSSFIRVPADADTLAAYCLKNGDVLFNNTNSTDLVGKTALFESYDKPVVFSNHFARIRTDAEKLYPRFLALWLQHQWQRRVFANICDRWIGQSAVQRDKLLALEIALPPLAEQKRIAGILTEQMAAVDAARRSAEAQLQATEALPAAHLRAVFNSPEAQSWPRKKLGDHVTKVGSGFTPLGGQSSYQQSGIPLIRSQNIHMNRFERDGLAFISDGQDAEMEGSCVEKGDVLLNITGASIGRVCIAPAELCPANVNQHVSIIRSDGFFEPAFLAFYISTPDFQKFILDSQAGATRQALTKIMIEDFQIPFPPLDDQRRIASQLSSQMASAARLRQTLADELDAINKLPAALLREAFAGKL